MATDVAVSGLADLLRSLLADFQRTASADIVSLFLYDDVARRYYAPFALGQPEDSLLDSLADMQAQLGRYLSDVAQDKVPDELRVPQYGSTVWLTVTRHVLEARDAPSEIDSTFVRRHRVESTLGLPLLAGDRLVGLVYLNYVASADGGARRDDGRKASRVPTGGHLAGLQQKAAESAREIQRALARAERRALEGIGRLTSHLALQAGAEDEPESADGAGGAALRRQLSIALADLLLASDLDAAAVYQLAPGRAGLELVTAHAPGAAPPKIDLPTDPDRWESTLTEAVASAMTDARLHPAATYALGAADEPLGYLIVLRRDPLATVRRAPGVEVLLRSAADLLRGAMASRRMIATLVGSNRRLGALSRMSTAMLRPGSSRLQVLEAVAGNLTDAAVPEFDFDFATVYLLDELAHSTTVVRLSAGPATSEAIDATHVGDGGSRVPRWALEHERVLTPSDVLSFVAS